MDSHCWTVRHDRERVHALSGSSVCEARSCTSDAGTQDLLFRSRLDRLRQRNLDALDRNPCVMRRIPELATLIRLRGGWIAHFYTFPPRIPIVATLIGEYSPRREE